MTLTYIHNMCVNLGQKKCSYDLHPGPKPSTRQLIQFGRVGFVADRKKLKKKWGKKGKRMYMVGYALDGPSDCYRMYNPKTRSVVESRDVKWAPWRGAVLEAGVDNNEKIDYQTTKTRRSTPTNRISRTSKQEMQQRDPNNREEPETKP